MFFTNKTRAEYYNKGFNAGKKIGFEEGFERGKELKVILTEGLTEEESDKVCKVLGHFGLTFCYDDRIGGLRLRKTPGTDINKLLEHGK